jgi:eukaryotic-like serine/threonine-protein kinase
VTEQLRPADPRSVGPYRLTGRLGQGGMGDVFLGRSAGGRLVAVKVIRDDLAADPEFRARFRHEVEAARQVNGLYTAPVADADVDGPVPWLATAYVPGPSLADAIEGHGPLPVRSVLALAAGLAEGLGAVHAAGLIHRDIKPSNVLLAADGPRVIDFGIARGTQSTVLTLAGRVIGSPDFMSPEQAYGRGIGPPSDMFSLGAVLLFAATGHPPFHGGMTTVLERIVTDTPDLSRVPPEVRPLIEWCMRKEPSERPTPQALLDRLGDIRLWDDWLPESLLADIPGGRAATVPPARPRHDDTRTTQSPAATDPGRNATDPSRNDAEAAPRRRPARHRGRRRVWLIASAASLVALAAAGGGLWLALGSGHGHHPLVTRPSASRSAAPKAPSPYMFAVSGVTTRACSAGLASANGRAASITFTDKTKTQLLVYWLNYLGQRSLLVTLRPNESRQVKGNVGDAWQVADPRGCVADFASTRTGSVTIEAAAKP